MNIRFNNLARVVFNLRANCQLCGRVNVPAHFNHAHLIVCALCTMTGKGE
jgi:hypothetical protein